MQEDVVLKLHCRQCNQLAEVVVERQCLVCVECGWRFDENISARFVNGKSNAQASDEMCATESV